MTQKVCPYPGLRPFTVEEAFFFKGRDLHVRQIITKLEVNKILILTGASGDGKSSLVYAGVIPSARAGFFRAKYNKWVFVDFQPERSPLQNLAKSISSNLNIDLKHTEQELSYGFSAIIDLYKSSKYYIDEESDEWKNLNDHDKKQRKLSAANLFILADQFEEFYTNTENFADGKASVNAYTTVNLLLESARIARRDNIPLYVICTLRSDFISQCIAFRGLPEAIGFSQFFVPRLNRNELQQVIEEPAILSAGKVSKRLKEVLINELHDGFDQLPLLQHTLKQLWIYADNGNEELDMIHLAKLAGLNTKFLTTDDKLIFDKWFGKLESFQKKYFENPSSSNVLNAHANFLFENAYDYYLKNIDWAEKNISEQDAKLIIKISFQCLTKIDEGRAVRNRTTLEEITNIINKPHIKYENVCGILNIFRLHYSTFLRPFVNEKDVATQFLPFDAVLDITHEALIRNWEYLKKWNEEENTNITNFKEFEVQLNRWLCYNQSKDYLLPIGPLSHFETWYKQCNPSKYWLSKYDNSSLPYNEKVQKAAKISESSEQFLSASRKFIVDTEKLKRRRKNFALFAALAVIVGLTYFSFWAMKEKAYAQRQKIYAEQQTDSAKFQQQRALEANKIAGHEKLIAEENARKALFAKQQSDSARNLALKLRSEAENLTKIAHYEAENATREKQIADEQRNKAEMHRKHAESASDSAKKLSYVAISQSLALKAIQKFDDIQLNILLAMQAYNFNKTYSDYNRPPSLYNALRIAETKSGDKNVLNISSNAISSIFVSKNILIAVCKNGQLIKYDVIQQKKTDSIFIPKPDIPINSSYILTPSYILFCLENKELFLYNSDLKKTFKLTGHSDYVRAAAYNPNNKMLVTAGREKSIIVWRLNDTGVENVFAYNFDFRFNTLQFSSDYTTFFAGSALANIIQCNPEKRTQTNFESQKTSVQSIMVSANGKYLVAGCSSGVAQLFDCTNNNKLTEITVSSSAVRFVAIDDKSAILATACDDKILRIYDLNNLNRNPITINDFSVKINSMNFAGDRLYILLSNNSIVYYENEPSAYAIKLQQKLTRNFTIDEWKIYVGEKVPYEKTK